ncbi:hypothetical protein C7444_10848 [Sphaerotilus hippei]|uniref:STAS domain-containing protein n=1 Tax=Sphaerotilus hippei TaxID=744406 RepID=A0A318H0S6_9BURK|nr:hypothetical protein [Sphaerotilus hippei]PXW95789.1 hypothetical protein C7444_10848 [Sphaerotilus hippei]
MADSTDSPKSGFFRKVVRFALNPTTDWADLNQSSAESRESEYAKTELKAMIERKRRNDFVRKREFDMLRKIRREGVTGEGIAGLEGLSRIDDSEVRINDSVGARSDQDVKDKIDAIERMMVGDSAASQARRGAAVVRSSPPQRSDSFFAATTAPQVMPSTPLLSDAFKPTTPMLMESEEREMAAGHFGEHSLSPGATSTQSVRGDLSSGGRLPRVSAVAPLMDSSNAYAVEVIELAHDPDLDEAVIAFANADFEHCDQALQNLIGVNGSRAQHAETWFALFDLYRATGQQLKFDSLAMDYMQRFGWSPPQWFSLPRLVADAATASKGRSAATTSHAQLDASVGWVAPERLDLDAVVQLRSQLLQMPLPWVLDWRNVHHIEVEACTALSRLLHDWADEPIDMRWVAGERLFTLLAETAPSGAKDADPAYWLLRLEALRLAQRPAEFDQAAIDYCLTYEVSPPSWSPAQCSLRMSDASGVAQALPDEQVQEMQPGFVESRPYDEEQPHQITLELNGQLVGDISLLLKEMEAQIGDVRQIQVSCARLIRVDFIAAGDLLNWVLNRRTEDRSVTFVDAHRLVALFCGAMGITEHARVTVRRT